jgi:hypothetical protein
MLQDPRRGLVRDSQWISHGPEHGGNLAADPVRASRPARGERGRPPQLPGLRPALCRFVLHASFFISRGSASRERTLNARMERPVITASPREFLNHQNGRPRPVPGLSEDTTARRLDPPRAKAPTLSDRSGVPCFNSLLGAVFYSPDISPVHRIR